MATPTEVSAYMLTVALLTLMVVILSWHRQRSGKTVSIWLASGSCGILLGASASLAAIHLAGLQVVRVRYDPSASLIDTAGGGPTPPSAAGMPASSGMPGMSIPGMPGGMGMGGGGIGGPQPKRDLGMLVQKTALLTGDVALHLSEPQVRDFLALLDGVEERASMTDDQAQHLHDRLRALFTPEQTEKLDAVRPAARNRGGGMGGESPPPDANPFTQTPNADALRALRERFASAPTKAPAATPGTIPETSTDRD